MTLSISVFMFNSNVMLFNSQVSFFHPFNDRSISDEILKQLSLVNNSLIQVNCIWSLVMHVILL